MWLGDVREFMRIYYSAYFYRTYVGLRRRYSGLKKYEEVYKSIMDRINDINDAIIVTKDELKRKVIPEEYIHPNIQPVVLDAIIELHELNEERSYYDDFELLPVSSTAIVVKRNGNIKHKFIGFNKTAPDFDDLKIFKEKFVGDYPKTIHAEVDTMYKVWRKYGENGCSECTLYLVIVRNGHNILSRPCKYCRRMVKNTQKDIGFERVVFIYPMIDNLIVVEKFL